MDKNEILGIIIFIVLILMIIGFIIFSVKSDKHRCEKHGGTYIWEYSYGSKCHLPNNYQQ